MPRWLLWLFLPLLSCSIDARNLYAQYISLDLNDDTLCDANDHVSVSQVDSFDVWIDTSKNQDGSSALCPTGEDLTIAAYEIILRADAGTAILSWTNSRPEFNVEEYKSIQPHAAWIGYSSPGGATNLPPGKYLLGRAGYQHTSGCPYITVAVQEAAFPAAQTKFYSRCPGSEQDYYLRLGADFQDVCGAYSICEGVQRTTWGQIKNMYR